MMRHSLKFGLLLFIIFSSCESGHHESNDNDGLDESTAIDNPFVHTAYFWFNEGVSEDQLSAFYTDTEKLRDIKTVKALYYGKPANTDRPVVEKSYDFAVVVHFENLAGHDTYQQDPIHLALLENHSGLWEKVMVTDVDPH